MRRPSRLYWACQALGWGIYALLILALGIGYRPKDMAFIGYMWRQVVEVGFAVLCGLGLTHAWRAYMQKHKWIEKLGGLPILRMVAGVFVLATIELLFVFFVSICLHPSSEDEVRQWLVQGLPITSVGWLSIYLVWTVLYVAVVSRRHTLRVEVEKLELELHVKDAELRALQAQVNPHFFFNSLNSIRALVYQDAKAAANAIDRLSSMMRYTLQSGSTEAVLFEEEMQAIRNYLAIERVRFEERLCVRESIAENLGKMLLPPMALQTLVENAVKYGVEMSAQPCELIISATRDGDRVELSVSNRGQIQTRADSTRVGLRNTERRLALIFGKQTSVQISEANGMVTTRLNFPYTERAA